jgi:hypothetical protein
MLSQFAPLLAVDTAALRGCSDNIAAGIRLRLRGGGSGRLTACAGSRRLTAVQLHEGALLCANDRSVGDAIGGRWSFAAVMDVDRIGHGGFLFR